ncbi:hypothetical protein NM688_g8560 [Phlebia brevispora]|uniref:Uncharacterized protein n=1 Tax=Phlebia brevispora TaxID=194682 RepID=A0ACC1RTK5_9APHY|nr:hypothetical protein NM688_g8560 [Phlebia brevispora]
MSAPYDFVEEPAPPLESEVLSPVEALAPPTKLPLGLSSQTLLVASCFLAVILLAIFLVARRKSRTKGTALLIVGASDAGKTAILTTLAYNQTLPTQTSMQTNSSIVTLPGTHKTMLVIDVPGHPRVRNQFRDYMQDAKAIAFVVDASTVSRNGANVAEHLHEVLHALSSLPPSATPPSLVIVAHKADALKTAASASASQLAVNRVRTVLERELEKRRASHSGVGIEGLGDDERGAQEGEIGMGDVLECPSGGEFRFERWEGGEVQFIGTSVTIGKSAETGQDEKETEEDGLKPLREWLTELP